MRTDDNLKVKKDKELERVDVEEIAQRKTDFIDLGESIRKQVESGASFSGGESNHLWFNLGGEGFIEQSGVSGANHSGDSRSMAVFDFDRDGYQDFAMVNANAPWVQLFRNRIGDRPGADAGFVALRFVGGKKGAEAGGQWSSRDGYGVKAVVSVGGQRLLRELRCGEGLAAQNSRTLIVGIGEGVRRADGLEVSWPGGAEQALDDLDSGSLVTVYENPADSPTGEAFVVSEYAPARRAAVAEAGHANHEEHGPALEFTGETGRDAELRLYVTTFTTCSACKKRFPRLEALKQAFGDRVGLYGVPVNPSETAADWAAYNQKYQPAYEVLTGLDADQVEQVLDQLVFELKVGCGEAACECDPPCHQAKADGSGGVGIPSTVITDGEGKVIKGVPGVPSVSEVRQILANNSH